MLKATGQATITTAVKLVPIAGDGECGGPEIAEATVECALKSFEWIHGYIGFSFNEVATAKVKLDTTGEEMSFTSKKNGDTVYRFANKLISTDELRTSPAYRDAFNQISQINPEALDKDELFFFETKSGRVGRLSKNEMKNIVMITPQGDQLWPLKKAM